MAKNKPKFYVVWKGHSTGVFDFWEEAQKQIQGFKGAVYKSFESHEEAVAAFKQPPPVFKSENKPEAKPLSLGLKSTRPPAGKIMCVDAACSGNPGLMEYRGVYYPERVEAFHVGPIPNGTNNIGEFLAIVHAWAFQEKNNLRLPIYSDSKTAIAWIKSKNVRTQLPRSAHTERIWELIDRAIVWLKNSNFRTPLNKWETEVWGEIPADFGRK